MTRSNIVKQATEYFVLYFKELNDSQGNKTTITMDLHLHIKKVKRQ